MIRFAKQFRNLTIFSSSLKVLSSSSLPLINESLINLSSQQMNYLGFSQRGLLLNTHYSFSRKKKQNLDLKLDQSLNREYFKQLQRQDKSRKLSILQQIKYQKKYYLSIGTFIALVFYSFFHLLLKQNEIQEKKIVQKMNQRKNFQVIPEIKLRQVIANGAVMNHQLEIVRRNRKGSLQHSTLCFIKSSTGQTFTSEIISLNDFLRFVQAQPIDYKVSFQYESYAFRQSQFPYLKKFTKILGFVTFLMIARKGFKYVKKILTQRKSQNMFDLDTKKIQAIKPENINTLFKDVAGMHEAKFQITQFVDFLKQPQRYHQMGAKVPKGALLTGPPGTGKTLLARACAGQADVPFYYVSGSDFVQKYVGLGASRVRKLFDQAEKNAPSIIFIDEIDAIGKKRDSGPFANEQRDNTLNQLLVRMDGFDSKNKVIVMGATNIKDSLDPALLRPGRFDRSVQIGLPNFEQRKQILQVHLKKVKFDPQFTIEQLANRVSILTPGFSGAELANVCNEAAILAARQALDVIDMSKFQKATERVMAGLEKRNLFTDQEKIMLSYYEAGKAVVGWFTQGSDPIIKLSILPFSKASKGYSHTIKDQIGLNIKQDLLGKVCFYLAGRASENYFKNYVTTNGDTDLKRAKRIISLLVTKFGMSDRLKNIAFPDIQFVRKPYSSQIQFVIDEEIERFTLQCKEKVEKLIVEKKDLIQKLQAKLLQKQSLNHSEIKEILGDRPFQSNENYQKYVIEEQKSHMAKKKIEGSQKLQQEGKNQFTY